MCEEMVNKMRSVLFDSCIINRLAAMQADPIRDFEGTEFEVVCTPDLRLEYREAERRASDKDVQQLAGRFAVAAGDIGIFGFDGPPFLGFDEGTLASPEQIDVIESTTLGPPRKATAIPKHRTDSHLVALAQIAIGVTDNSKGLHWKRVPKGTGCLVSWSALEPALLKHKNVATALRQIVT
jgi:hypothetical protein